LAVDRKETSVRDSYQGATGGELLGAPFGRRVPAGSEQRRRLPDQRSPQLAPRTLVLGGWRVIRREAAANVRLTSTDAYRRGQAAGLRGNNAPGLPEPPGRPVSARKTTPRPARSWLGRGVLIAGLAMIPWVFILACSVPPTIRAAHWSTAWAGLDALEAVGLMTTGVALIGRYNWLCLPAAVTSTFLVVDAWFDITTSAPGPAVTVAIAMAVFPELPMAGLCAVLAIGHTPGCTACHRRKSHHERLTLLTTGERYGFQLTGELGARGQILASEGSQ
jgi:hypothetical protein